MTQNKIQVPVPVARAAFDFLKKRGLHEDINAKVFAGKCIENEIGFRKMLEKWNER